MTYSPLQLEAIKLFGRKELTEGCYVIVDSVGQKYSEKPQKGRIAKYITDGKYLSRTQILTCNDRNRRFKSSWELREIIGHEPHLEDVFLVAKEKGWGYNMSDWTGPTFYEFERQTNFGDIKGYNPSLPLLEQSEETLTQLINLFK